MYRPFDRGHAEADGGAGGHPHARLDRPDQERHGRAAGGRGGPGAGRAWPTRAAPGCRAASRCCGRGASRRPRPRSRRRRRSRSARPSCRRPGRAGRSRRPRRCTSRTATSSRRSATSVPTTVRLDVFARGAARNDADRVAGAGGEDVVAHVADHGQRVRVAALRGGALVLEQPLPALAAHERREPVERDRADQRRDLARGGRELRRVLLGRPPDDDAERDDADEDDRGSAARSGGAGSPGRPDRRVGRRPRGAALRWAYPCSLKRRDLAPGVQDRRLM